MMFTYFKARWNFPEIMALVLFFFSQINTLLQSIKMKTHMDLLQTIECDDFHKWSLHFCLSQ